MNKRSFLICSLASVGIAWSPATVGQEKATEATSHTSWRVSLTLDTPNLNPPAVQYSVFDKDPIPGFKANLDRMRGYHQKQLEQDKSEANRSISRSTFLTVSWNKCFKAVTGDEVYLLTKAPGVSHSLSSNSDDGKKWVVTKIVRIKGEPVCWCLPVEVKAGEHIRVEISEDNAFDLGKVYRDTMSEYLQSKSE